MRHNPQLSNYMINANIFFCLTLLFKTGFLWVALVVLELALYQTGCELRDRSASASEVLGLKTCATTAQFM